MSENKKVLIWIGAIILLVLVVLYIVGANAPQIEKWKLERTQVAYDKMVQTEIDKYKQDFDGGRTPEETLDLFIVALKAGDIVKASRYYELSVQDKELTKLMDKIQKNGNVYSSANFFDEFKTKGEKKCNTKNDGCVIEYFYVSTEDRTLEVEGMNQKVLITAGEKSLRSISFSLNKYTNIWKISQ